MFPDPEKLKVQRIKEKLSEGLSAKKIALWFASKTIARVLASYNEEPLDEFFACLEEKLIITTDEKNALIPDINTKMETTLSKFCGFLQKKSDGDIEEFLEALEEKHSLARLGGYLRRLISRCNDQAVDQTGGQALAAGENSHYHLGARAELPTDDQGRVILMIAVKKQNFLNRVLGDGVEILSLNQGSILLEFGVQDYWDVENIQYDIQSGMFVARMVTWLQEQHIVLDRESVRVEITDIKKEKGPLEPGADIGIWSRVYNSRLEGVLSEITESIGQIDSAVAEVIEAGDLVVSQIDSMCAETASQITDEQQRQKERVNQSTQQQVETLQSTRERATIKLQMLNGLKQEMSSLLQKPHETSAIDKFQLEEKLREVEGSLGVVEVEKPTWKGREGGESVSELASGLMGEVLYDKVLMTLGHAHMCRKYWHGDFLELFERPITKISEIKLGVQRSNTFTLYMDKVLVPLHETKVIEVHGKDKSPIKTISTDGKPTCVETMPMGQLLVSCSDIGLFMHDDTVGLKSVRIAEGSYSDMCHIGHRVYCFDYIKKEVVPFARDTEKGWVQYGKITSVFALKNTSQLDKLLVRQTKGSDVEFYISVLNTNTISLFDSNGQLLKEVGTARTGHGDLLYPYLCCMDRSGNLLVADAGHNQYKVFNAKRNTWKPVYTTTDFVYSAQLEGDNTLWLRTGSKANRVITKYHAG